MVYAGGRGILDEMTTASGKNAGAGANRAKRLAQALRENLRRRKALPVPRTEEPDKVTEKPETDRP
jgi:hypothetical protein